MAYSRAVQNHIDDANTYLENINKIPVVSSDPADALAGERRLKIAQIHALLVACSRWMSPSSFRVLWPDVGLEGTMSRWLVGSGIPRRTSCASCAELMN